MVVEVEFKMDMAMRDEGDTKKVKQSASEIGVAG
jgi:hypothetical protein